jgi:hypothetical protein
VLELALSANSHTKQISTIELSVTQASKCSAFAMHAAVSRAWIVCGYVVSSTQNLALLEDYSSMLVVH